MKKRVLAAVLAGAMMAALLTGCAGSGKSETRAVMQRKTVTQSELNSLQSMVHWITAGKDFLKGLEEEGIKEGRESES